MIIDVDKSMIVKLLIILGVQLMLVVDIMMNSWILTGLGNIERFKVLDLIY